MILFFIIVCNVSFCLFVNFSKSPFNVKSISLALKPYAVKVDLNFQRLTNASFQETLSKFS